MQAKVYWQGKIWGLLHDPALKALHNNAGRGKEGLWQQLHCMTDWVSPKAKSLTASPYSTQWLKRIGLCDLIASASDRAAIGRIGAAVDYDDDGIEIKHLLSGETQKFQLGNWHQRLMESDRAEWLEAVETILIPEEIQTCSDPRKVFWWFWRCYPVALSRGLDRDGHFSYQLSVISYQLTVPQI